MKKETTDTTGIQKLIRRCKFAFRIPENMDYYSDEDFKAAERKFIKNACVKGTIPIGTDSSEDKLSFPRDTQS